MELLYKDLSLNCPEINITDINVVLNDFKGKGKVLRFIFDGNHAFDQVYYSKNSYEQNLKNTITIIEKLKKEEEDAAREDIGKAKDKD